MKHKLMLRAEAVLAGVCAVLTVAALVRPTWIESVFDASPDSGTGSAERLLALVWLAGTLLFSTLAVRERGRTRAATSGAR